MQTSNRANESIKVPADHDEWLVDRTKVVGEQVVDVDHSLEEAEVDVDVAEAVSRSWCRGGCRTGRGRVLARWRSTNTWRRTR